MYRRSDIEENGFQNKHGFKENKKQKTMICCLDINGKRKEGRGERKRTSRGGGKKDLELRLRGRSGRASLQEGAKERKKKKKIDTISYGGR